MTRRRLAALLVAVFAAATARPEGAPDPAKSQFLVFSGKKDADFTELQRLALGRRPRPRNTVVVNGSAAVRADGSLDPAGVDLVGLERVLHEPVRFKVGGQKDRIEITIGYYERRPTEAGRQVLYWALKGMALDLGYDDIDVSTALGSDGDWWKGRIAERKAYDTVGRSQPAEPGVGDEFVRAFAVKAEYSRFLFPGADCVVSFRKAFAEGWDGRLSADQEKAVLRAVGQLSPDGKKRINFRIAGDKAGQRALQEFDERTAPALGAKAGFDKHSTTTMGEPD